MPECNFTSLLMLSVFSKCWPKSKGPSQRTGPSLALALGLLVAAAQQASLAQGLDCRQLQSQIASLDEAEARRPNPYAGAAQKQQAELNRAAAYAHSMGCDRQQFLFFGNPPPPQCNGLNANIRALQANLAQTQAASLQASNSRLRQQLTDRFNAYCRGGTAQRQPGFFEQLFGIVPSPAPALIPLEEQPHPEGTEESVARGGSQAVCVRTCDGGFFPLNYSAKRTDSQTLTELCQALCPNVETAVYTRSPSREIQSAVSLDGVPYVEMQNALKYQKVFDASCTCKSPKQSWVEALSGAEQLLGHQRKGDIMVTPEKSLEMSRPVESKTPNPSRTAKANAEQKLLPAPSLEDDLSKAEAKSGAEVPTASKDSSGIASKDAPTTAPVFQRGQGALQDVIGPDGVKRRVRIVGPML
jgi:hypothetical protein